MWAHRHTLTGVSGEGRHLALLKSVKYLLVEDISYQSGEVLFDVYIIGVTDFKTLGY